MIKTLTQHEKSLVIANEVYGENRVTVCKAVILGVISETEKAIQVHHSGSGFKDDPKIHKHFNPYKSAEDAQAVQVFFKVSSEWSDEEGLWLSYSTYSDHPSMSPGDDLDLKKAISDCAARSISNKMT